MRRWSSQGRLPVTWSERPLRIALAQWHPRPGEPAANLAVAAELIAQAGAEHCGLVVMPELWPSGYDPDTLAADIAAAAEPLEGPRGRALGELARRHRLWLCAGSVPELDAGNHYNTTPLYAPDGRLVASHRKFHRYLPGGEDHAFEAGTGPTVYDPGNGEPAIGLSVCFDGDFPETARALRAAGARIVLEPAAYENAAESWWERLYPAHALVNGQWWVLVNQAGGGCFGRSRVISPTGEIVAEAPRATADAAPTLHVIEVDLAAAWEIADAEAAELFSERAPEAPVAVVRGAVAAGRS
jgi:predicted amidohydrolase